MTWYTPTKSLFTRTDCACSPSRFCLWHYGKMRPAYRARVRAALGLRLEIVTKA